MSQNEAHSFTTAEQAFMARAIDLARKGQFSASPNPRVGCVLVKDGAIIAEGWHERPGGPHAEAMALHNAGAKAKGSTAYITLEPCSFVGRTPACSTSLVEAGVASVVCAMRDPHFRVSGSGFAELQRAGIGVKNGLLESQSRLLNSGYIKRQQTGLPHLTVKMAMSLDGRTAMANGESQWVTGEQARQDVQALRAQSCAILTGIGTVLSDNPMLNVRREMLEARDTERVQLMDGRQPLRVILDRACQTTADMNIVQAQGKVLLFTTEAAAQASALQEHDSVDLVVMPNDLRGVLQELGQREINEVLVEAGATLSGAFMRQGLVDQLIIYVAPKLLGSSARPLFDLVLESMNEAVELDIERVQSIGADLRIDAIPQLSQQ